MRTPNINLFVGQPQIEKVTDEPWKVALEATSALPSANFAAASLASVVVDSSKNESSLEQVQNTFGQVQNTFEQLQITLEQLQSQSKVSSTALSEKEEKILYAACRNIATTIKKDNPSWSQEKCLRSAMSIVFLSHQIYSEDNFKSALLDGISRDPNRHRRLVKNITNVSTQRDISQNINEIYPGSSEMAETPPWVPPKQRFPLTLEWAGNLNRIYIKTGQQYEIVEIPSSNEVSWECAGGVTTVNMDSVNNQESLLVYLRTKNVPKTGLEETLTVEFDFEYGSAQLAKTQFEILRANISATVIEYTDPKPCEIDLKLQNTGDLRAEVEIVATTAGEKIGVTPESNTELLKGFLNIGVHDVDPENLKPHRDLTKRDQRLLRQSCEIVQETLRDEIEPPSPYSKHDLEQLRPRIEIMLNRDQFGLLTDVIPDIKLTFLQSVATVQPDEGIWFTSPIEAIEVPTDANVIHIQIRYEDPNGTKYEPVTAIVQQIPNFVDDVSKCIPVNLLVSSE